MKLKVKVREINNNLAPLISVVIPVYQAEACLQELYSRLVDTLEIITKNFEIILVEDCGGDNSWDVIRSLSTRDGRVRGIQFSRNFGQHYGITAGLNYSSGSWVVVMDCDLQDRPEEILRLYEKSQEGYDVVLARRGKRNDALIKRLLSSCYYSLFTYLSDIKYDGEVGNFRILSRKVVDNFSKMEEQLRFFGGMIQWMGYPTSSIDVEHAARFHGKSSYTFSKLLKLATETIIAYSDKPLRISIKFGFLIAFSSFVYGFYIFLMALTSGTSIPGWNSIIVSIYFIGGILIGLIGILGVYVGKTFDEAKGRPLYIIRRTTFDEAG